MDMVSGQHNSALRYHKTSFLFIQKNQIKRVIHCKTRLVVNKEMEIVQTRTGINSHSVETITLMFPM